MISLVAKSWLNLKRLLAIGSFAIVLSACGGSSEDSGDGGTGGDGNGDGGNETSYSVNYTLSGNVRDVPFEYSVNGENYSLTIESGSGSLSEDVSEGDELVFFEPDLTGHECVPTPASTTVTDEDINLTIECETFGQVTSYITDYSNGDNMGSAQVRILATTEAGADIDDENAYESVGQGVTNEEGTVVISGVGYSERVIVEVSADGYMSRSSVLRTSMNNPNVTANVALLAVEEQVAFDSSIANTVEVEGTTSMDLPENSFVDANGDPVSEEITANIISLDASSDSDILPGDFAAYNSSTGTIDEFEIYGAVSVSFESNGENVQLAEDATATLRIPVAERAISPPNTVDLANFNESTGLWQIEGEGLLQTDPDTGELYYEGSVGHFSSWGFSSPLQPVYIHGCILNAEGEPAEGVKVTVDGQDYIGRSEAFTNNEGQFSVPVKPNSQVLLTSNQEGSLSNTIQLNVNAEDVDLENCLNSIEGSMRITLSWGQSPRDLDAHFMGPTVTNGVFSNDRFRVYYSNKTVSVNDVVIDLDVDDVTSFGPEVVTVPSFPYPGVYRYAVHHYAGSSTIFNSPTRIEVELESRSFVFSPSEDNETNGDNDTWVVFDLTVSESGDVSIETVDTYVPRSNSDINPEGENAFSIETFVEK